MKKTTIFIAVFALRVTIGGAFALNLISGPFASKDNALAASNDPAFYNNLGVKLSQEGNTADAALAFRHAIALNTNYEKARSNLATLSFSAGDYDTAIEQLRWLVANTPSGNYHFDLAQNLASNARYNTGNLDELREAANEFDIAAGYGVAHASENAAIVRAVIADFA